MIRKHWIVRYRSPKNSGNVKLISQELDSLGYESALFTIHSQRTDMWTQIANGINENHTIKYMIAVRPYLFSPQFLAMLVASFNTIAKDRLTLNIVHGDLQMPENLDGIMLNGLELSNSKNRKEYTAEFLHKLLNDVQMIDGIEMPEILVSGDSDESIYLAKKTSNIIAVTYESFMKDPTRVTKHGFEKIFLYLSVLVTDTDEEAKIEIDSISESEKVLNGSPFYGSKETLTDKIIELQSMGITDIFFSQFDRNHDREPVHSFLSELTNKGILS